MVGVFSVAGADGPGERDSGECGDLIFRGVLCVSDVLAEAEAVFRQSVFCGDRALAGEYPYFISNIGAGSARLPVSAGLDSGEFSAALTSLDVCAGAAVPGAALVKLILAVFGIAAVLIVVWAVLFIMGTRGKQ